MSVLSLQDVAVSFGGQDVLDDITAEVNAGDRIGLVGRNGAGKTTLLHVISGDLRANAGSRFLARNTSIALVEQIPSEPTSSETVYTEVLLALSALIEMEGTLHRTAEAMGEGIAGAAEEFAALEEAFEVAGGYTYHVRLSQVLEGLGFKATDWGQPVAELSGGQRTRLALAKALLQQPDLLLLDEPTNHIDWEAMAWLDDFLAHWPGTLIVTSHDRYFLDRVTNRVWFLEDSGLRTYRGNYSAFEEQRAAEIERKKRESERQREFIAREEAFIRRYRAGQRAREAQGRQKRLDRLERIEGPEKQRKLRFGLKANRSGDVTWRATRLNVGYAGALELHAGDLIVERGDRVALIGANGSGKTTLLKTIAGELDSLGGELRLGSQVKVAHYWQEGENLGPTHTVLEELRWDRRIDYQVARDVLGHFLFSGDDVDKLVSSLSGGERSRLALAKLMLDGANLLLLDEPTNHLDIPSREALEETLEGYDGTIILISHDRQLISTLATRIWSIEESRLEVFEGGYTEFREAQAAAAAAAVTPALKKPGISTTAGERELRRRAQEAARLEAEIEESERRLELLGEEINGASERGDVAALADLGRQFAALEDEVRRLMAAWTEAAG